MSETAPPAEKARPEASSSKSNSTLQPTPDEVQDVQADDKPKMKDEGDRPVRADGKQEIQEEEAYEKLGFAFPVWRKWMILSVIFLVQTSMNFNASVYPNAIEGMTERFGISEQAARVGQMIFLIAYAFGCELWAAPSEELGRWPVLQLSLLLVNIWQIPFGLAQNFGTVIVARFLGGISSAGGSVTLAMVADMFQPEEQQYPVAFVVLSSVGGSVLGPIVGGFLQHFLDWRWNAWIQLIFGVTVQILHFFLVPETRSTILLDREAKRRRKAGESNIWGPNELKENRFEFKEVIITLARPFEMFLREPIVLCLSLLSGFSDALIFTFLESFTPVFEQWNFTTVTTGLAFCSIAVGYFIAYASYVYPFTRFKRIQKHHPEKYTPEMRLWWLLWTVPLEPLGLFGFAWTSLGPPRVHWIAPLIFASCIGVANYTIYMSTIDYMIASYGPYSASATGGNGFARDFLAGIAAMYSTPMYETMGLEWASTLLAFLAVLVAIPVYVFYYYGPEIRARSKFAQTLASERSNRKTRVATLHEKAAATRLEDGPQSEKKQTWA